jgi:cell division protein FtsW
MKITIPNFKLHGDKQIWTIVFILSLISTLVVYSATGALAHKRSGGNTEWYLFKHVLFILIGLYAIWYIHQRDYTLLSPISRILLWITPLLILYTYFFGVEIGGARRWFKVFGISFQTSEFVKLILITNLSAMLAKNISKEYNQGMLWGLIGWIGVICCLLAMTNFSTALLLGLTCFIIMWLGRVPYRFLFRMLLVVLVGIGIAVAGSLQLKKYGINFGRGDVVVYRTESFLKKDLNRDKVIGDPNRDNEYQKNNAMAAIATGGMIGVGSGHSGQRNHLPEAFSDYIYAILIEEYGLIGGIFVMILYLWLLIRGLKNIELTDRAFGGLLCVGLTFSIVFQAFAHIIINVGLGPVTGQPMPLMSMGGTAFIFTSISIGIVLSVTRDYHKEEN